MRAARIIPKADVLDDEPLTVPLQAEPKDELPVREIVQRPLPEQPVPKEVPISATKLPVTCLAAPGARGGLYMVCISSAYYTFRIIAQERAPERCMPLQPFDLPAAWRNQADVDGETLFAAAAAAGLVHWGEMSLLTGKRIRLSDLHIIDDRPGDLSHEA